MDLTLERKEERDDPALTGPGGGTIMMTPALNEDYWAYRVRVTDKQAIVGFPKFGTVGVGFAVEGDDWNTNLPYRCPPEEIWKHIQRNAGDPAITEEVAVAAIKLIQHAVSADKGETWKVLR